MKRRTLAIGMGLAVAMLGGCGKPSTPLPPGVRAIMKLDEGTNYVFRDEPSEIGGLCEGWNVISIESSRDTGPPMRNMMCWKEEDSCVFTVTKDQLTPGSQSWEVINDA